VTATNSTDGTSALVPPKKPKAHPTDFADARRACRTTTEREQLALVLRARWTSAELHEYARLYYFKNGRDYPTPSSYRRAIADLARHYHLMTCTGNTASDHPHDWLKQFRKDGSEPMPPRREGLLIRGRGLIHHINAWEYSWPGHTEEFRTFIEQRSVTISKTFHLISPFTSTLGQLRREPINVSCSPNTGPKEKLQKQPRSFCPPRFSRSPKPRSPRPRLPAVKSCRRTTAAMFTTRSSRTSISSFPATPQRSLKRSRPWLARTGAYRLTLRSVPANGRSHATRTTTSSKVSKPKCPAQAQQDCRFRCSSNTGLVPTRVPDGLRALRGAWSPLSCASTPRAFQRPLAVR
jgi:hypothetical protein